MRGKKPAVAVVCSAVAAFALAPMLWAALTVNINGPSTLWVPYNQCVTGTRTTSTNMGVSTWDWTFDTTQVSTSSSYSRTYCSPNLTYATSEFHTLGVWVTGGGQAAFDSHSLRVVFQAGQEGGGGCGVQIICDP